jgi:hypothetical protein
VTPPIPATGVTVAAIPPVAAGAMTTQARMAKVLAAMPRTAAIASTIRRRRQRPRPRASAIKTSTSAGAPAVKTSAGAAVTCGAKMGSMMLA